MDSRGDADNEKMSGVEIRAIEDDDRAFFETTLIKDCEIWIAWRSDRLAGFLALDGGSISQLYIDPLEQRKGIGTLLIDFAKRRSPTRLELHTHQANTGARAFYERNGFRSTGFGVSPPPESEPDVRYEWGGDPRSDAARA